jgi:hypothetical protein
MPGPFIDRIEGDWAVLISKGVERRVPRKSLPHGAREGAYLTPDLQCVDRAATEASEREARSLRGRLEKDDGGDFSL